MKLISIKYYPKKKLSSHCTENTLPSHLQSKLVNAVCRNNRCFNVRITWHIHTLCGKGKVHPRTGHEGPKGKQRYSSTLSLTSALDGSGWSMPRPSSFTPGKDPILIVWEAGWAPGLVRMGSENLVPHWDSIPGPSSPYRVPILTELSQPETLCGQNAKLPNVQAHGIHIYQVNHCITSYLLL